MRVAILADLHDNIWKLDTALDHIRVASAQVLIFCGDFCAPFSLAAIIEGFPAPIHAVLGNNDGDVLLLAQLASSAGRVQLHEPWGKVTLGGKKMAFAHYPEIAQGLARSGEYDLVFFGHTHRYEQSELEGALFLNPGEVMGRFGEPSWVLYDTESGRATRYLL